MFCPYLLISILISCPVIHPAPNIVVFLVDDLGYGDLGYTGHPTTASPHVDALAREGKVRKSYIFCINVANLVFRFLPSFILPVLSAPLLGHLCKLVRLDNLYSVKIRSEWCRETRCKEWNVPGCAISQLSTRLAFRRSHAPRGVETGRVFYRHGGEMAPWCWRGWSLPSNQAWI